MSKITPTPSFPVENQKERLRVFEANSKLKNHIQELTKDIFAQEDTADTMSMLGGNRKILWRPNNYRLKIPVKQGSIGNFSSIKGSMGIFPVEIGKKGLATLKINKRITLMIYDKCVVGVFSLKDHEGRKEWYKVEVDSVQAFEEWFDAKLGEIEGELRFEIAKLRGDLDFRAGVWIRHEDGVKNEEFLDTLSPELVLHDTYFKKVYRNEVEFKSPIYVKNFISNRALDRVAPEIVAELASLRVLINNGLKQKELGLTRWDDICLNCGYQRRRCDCASSSFKSQEEIWA